MKYRCLIFFILFASIIWAQTTSPFSTKLEYANGSAATGLDVDLYYYSSDTKAYDLTESAPGVYDHASVAHGEYYLYIGGANKKQLWHGTRAVSEFLDAVDPDADNYIDGARMEDSTITRPKLSTTINILLDNPGSGIAHPPDDVTLEFKIVGLDTSVGIKSSFLSDSLSASDTTDLKTRNVAIGGIINLIQLGTDLVGGGIFSVVDSSDYGSILTTATKGAEWFEHPVGDRAWVRDVYLNQGIGCLRDFGVVGDNSNDDTEEVRKALQSGIKIMGVGGDTCRLTSTIRISDISVNFSSEGGKTIFLNATDDTMFVFTETMVDTVDSLVQDGRQGENNIVVSDGTQFSAGDIIKIRTDTDWYNVPFPSANHTGEMNVVASVEADTLELQMSLKDMYAVEDGSEVAYIFLVDNPQPVSLRDMYCIIENQPSAGSPAIFIEYKENPSFTYSQIDSAMYMGVKFNYCTNIDVKKNKIQYSTKSGSGYAISISGCSGGEIAENILFNNRHHVDIGGGGGTGIPSHNVMVRHNDGSGTGNFSTHLSAENITFMENRIAPATDFDEIIIADDAFYIRSEDTKILNNIIMGNNVGYVVNGNGAPNLIVQGNVYNSSVSHDTQDSIRYKGTYGDVYDRQYRTFVLYQLANITVTSVNNNRRNSLIIKNNIMINCDPAASGFLYIVEMDTLWNVELSGNTYSTLSDNFPGWLLYSSDGVVLQRARVFSNNVAAINNKMMSLQSGITWGDSCYYEFWDVDGINKNINGLWGYNRVVNMDSAEIIIPPTDIMGNGEVRIDTNYVVEGICKFRFAENGSVVIEDTTGFSMFSTTGPAGTFGIYDAGTGFRMKNNLGNGRTVRIKIDYYK